jgi:hypothetical protein
MAVLSEAEQAGFTADQLTELAKFPESRLDDPAYRDEILAQWRSFPAVKIRAKVYFGSISQGTITWSAECDLTDEEKTAVQDLISLGGKPIDIIVDVIGGKRSVEQRLAALEA